MKIFKQFLDSYINSSIHIGFAVVSLVKITQISLSLEANLEIDFIFFFGTILGYNFLKYLEVFLTGKFRIKQNFDIVLVSSIAAILFLYYFFQLQTSIQLLFLKMGFLVLLYPFVRKWGVLKLFFVSICVALITVLVPILSQKTIQTDGYYFFLQRFCIVLSLLVPFEIADVAVDPKSLQTFPQLFGIFKTKIIGIVFLFIYILMDFNGPEFHFISLFISILILIFILVSNEKRSNYFTSFWVESIPIFWWLLLVLFQ